MQPEKVPRPLHSALNDRETSSPNLKTNGSHVKLESAVKSSFREKRFAEERRHIRECGRGNIKSMALFMAP